MLVSIGGYHRDPVNLYERAHLQATSARDLFASLLLSTRAPGDVYKSILLDRAPTFIGDEKIGGPQDIQSSGVYVSNEQSPVYGMVLSVRGSINPLSLQKAISAAMMNQL